MSDDPGIDDFELDPTTLLQRQAMDADVAAKQALEDATTAEGFWVAANARHMALHALTTVDRIAKETKAANIKLLQELADLDLKRAELETKRQDARNAQAKHDMEMVKLSWEAQKVRAEAGKIEREASGLVSPKPEVPDVT